MSPGYASDFTVNIEQNFYMKDYHDIPQVIMIILLKRQ